MRIFCLASDTFLTFKRAEHSFTRMSRMNYVSNVWDSCSDVHIKKLLSVHKLTVKVRRAASQLLPGRGHRSAYPLPLKQHLQYNKCILVSKVFHNKSSTCLRQLLHSGTRSSVNFRNSIIGLRKTRIDLYKVNFFYSGSYLWNTLPSNL